MIKKALLLLLTIAPAGRMHGLGVSNAILAVIIRYASACIVGADIGIGAMLMWGISWGVLSASLSGVAFSLGHGNFYAMQGAQDIIKPGSSAPEIIETHGGRWLWYLLTGSASVGQPAYSWFMMALKWLLVALPLGPYAIAIAIFTPAAYQVSFSKFGTSAPAEWLSTIFAGLVISHIALLAGSSWAIL